MTETSVVDLPENVKDLTGREFGKWTVVAFADRYKNGSQLWHTRCDCGNTSKVRAYALLRGLSEQCGRCARDSYAVDETDNVYGNYTVLGPANPPTRNGHRVWQCLCACGNIRNVPGGDLRRAATSKCRSCAKRTHGHTVGSVSVEYTTWASMKARCYNTAVNRYDDYGGRGIEVCERWRESFENFYEDMGDRPEGCTIDRRDNDGNYEPGNCRWESQQVQQNNRRNNVHVTHDGQTLTVADAARHYGLTPNTLRYRLNVSGWNVERALTQPVERSS